MAKRYYAYLHQNRHGTFTFRWRPPADLACCFTQRAFEFSLGTKVRTEAWRRALPCVNRATRALTVLRSMAAPKKPLLKTEFVRHLLLPDGTEEKLDYDTTIPTDVAEAERIVAEAKRAYAERATTSASTKERDNPNRSGEPRQHARRAGNGGPTIREAFATFCAEKRAEGAWKDPEHAERYDYGPIIADLIEVAGDRPIAKLAVEHLRKFKAQLIDSNAALRTKRKKLQRLGAFLNWARDVAEYTTVSTSPLKLGKSKGEALHYHPFTGDDLSLLFGSDAYRAHSFPKASEFWIPLLGLYTGARMNELAQLQVEDITELDDVPVLRINDEGDKRTKTPASTRTVPLHPALVAAGLLNYQAAIKAEGWHRLFPELTKSKIARYGYSKEPSERFTAYRRGVGVSPTVDRQKVFHSFRTTANSALRRLDVPLERRQRLVGHEANDTNNESYRPSNREEMFSIATLFADLKQLDFGLTHPTYVAKPVHAEERVKAAQRRIKRDKTGERGDLGALSQLTKGRTPSPP